MLIYLNDLALILHVHVQMYKENLFQGQGEDKESWTWGKTCYIWSLYRALSYAP